MSRSPYAFLPYILYVLGLVASNGALLHVRASDARERGRRNELAARTIAAMTLRRAASAAVAGTKEGKRTLTIRDSQHEYVYAEAP